MVRNVFDTGPEPKIMSNLLKGLIHVVISALLLVIPILLNLHPGILDVTLGGFLVTLYQWLVTKSTTMAFHK